MVAQTDFVDQVWLTDGIEFTEEEGEERLKAEYNIVCDV